MILSIKHYFEQSIYEKERSNLFKNDLYCGHVSMLQEVGSYMVLPWNKGKYVYRAADGYWLMSNVCAHRQALILEGSGTMQRRAVVCNLHGWAYNREGELIGTPKFEQRPPACKRERIKLKDIGGLLFASETLTEDMFSDFNLQPSEYVYLQEDIAHYKFNWKTFLEVYSENYHVDVFHPGLSGFVSTKGLEWHMAKGYHVCSVGIRMGDGSPEYAAYAKAIKELERDDGIDVSIIGRDGTPRGAVWFFAYPNVMIEFYPGMMIVAYVHPTGPETCEVYTQYFTHKNVKGSCSNLPQLQIDSYRETTLEDDEICERMHEGRRSLYISGQNMEGPYHPVLEAGMANFHKFYKDRMSQNDC